MAPQHSSFPLNLMLNHGSTSTCTTRVCSADLGTIKRCGRFAPDVYLFLAIHELSTHERGYRRGLAYLSENCVSSRSELCLFEDCTDKQRRYRRGVPDRFCGSTCGFSLQRHGHLTESCLQRHALKRIFWGRGTGHRAVIVLKRCGVRSEQFKWVGGRNTPLNVRSRPKACNTLSGLGRYAPNSIDRRPLRLRTAGLPNREAA